MIPALYALLFLITMLYAVVLDRARRGQRKWEPDWTWVEVAIGSGFCLTAATVATYAELGTASLVIVAFFWLAFIIGGAPIVAWQLIRMSSRHRQAAAEARRLLQREDMYVNAAPALAEPCRGEPHPGQGDC